ncbi:titin-like isoform X2 [Sparus aurata]|uniref:titin-like isoform X2 n=1 Tax=Sparus aurata TaxID=8175 RepID=UPI0011C1B021|nr:titin-like isoform X2 [Sparus aurata]
MEVSEGKVKMDSVRAVRLSLETSCSLTIKNITAEDAGRYISRQGEDARTDICTYLSVLTGVSGEVKYLYSRAGPDAILSCGRASYPDQICSYVTWFYSKDYQSQSITEVSKGKVKMHSVRAVRLSLDTSCSLIIKNITAEDAGRYICRQGEDARTDISTYLSVLTVSPSPPDADPKRDGEVTLECSLFRYTHLRHCPQISIRWMDETRTVLLGEGEGYKFHGQNNCSSSLTVKLQSGHNRTYTCQLVDENNVEIEADYTPVLTGDDQSDTPGPDPTNVPLSSIMLTLRVAGLMLMIVITVLVIRGTRNRKPPGDDNNVRTDGDEVSYENDVTRPAATRLD